MNLSLPLLDIELFRQGGEQRQQFLNDLMKATNEVGFFYLTNHGIQSSLIQDVFRVSKMFFQLPIEARRKVQMIHSQHFRGYTNINDEITLEKPDAREQFDFMPESEALDWSLIPKKEPWLRVQGPNQWPSELPEMKDILLEWQNEQLKLTLELVKAFALALGQPEGVFAETLKDSPSVLSKVIHYPGQEESDQGVGSHKDSGYVTLVCQDIEPGLEVLINDKWVLADIIPNTFIVNIGELLELASNGFLKATQHRVVSPKVGTSRFSSAFFLTARLDASVPLLKLPPELEKRATGITIDPKNPLFHRIGQNFLKNRIRSHPDVAAKYYADITIEAL